MLPEEDNVLSDCYEADGLLMFWSHTPRMPWQTDAYYDEQRRILRPTTFARLHENQWINPESRFLTGELWDACVGQSLTPLLPTQEFELCVGVDASTKGDSSAVVGAYTRANHVVVAFHKIWRPSREAPLDLEATVERYVREVCAGYWVRKILVDPFQMHRSITTLRSAGLPIFEFAQTESNVMRMGQCLYDLVLGKNLTIYPSAELREQALNTVAVEKTRGFAIRKEKASKKIDAIVALSMACVAVLDTPAYIPLRFLGVDPVRDTRTRDEIDAEENARLAAEAAASAEHLRETLQGAPGQCWFPGDSMAEQPRRFDRDVISALERTMRNREGRA